MVGIKETLVNGMNGLSGLNGHAATAPTRPYPPKLSYETIEAREQYTIPDHGFQDPNARKQRIIGIGAGASGIVSAFLPTVPNHVGEGGKKRHLTLVFCALR